MMVCPQQCGAFGIKLSSTCNKQPLLARLPLWPHFFGGFLFRMSLGMCAVRRKQCAVGGAVCSAQRVVCNG